jgi:predicted Ser/Thr protein kinase
LRLAILDRNAIISPISKYMWDHRDENFTVDDVPLAESPSLQPLLEDNEWDTVERVYPDADLSQWESPPSDTQTEELKEKTIKRMKETMNYSDKSAEAVSKKVVEYRNSVNEVNTNGS